MAIGILEEPQRPPTGILCAQMGGYAPLWRKCFATLWGDLSVRAEKIGKFEHLKGGGTRPLQSLGA